MMDIAQIIVTAGVSGFASGVGTLLVLKNDVKWLKQVLENHDDRIRYLERKAQHELARR